MFVVIFPERIPDIPPVYARTERAPIFIDPFDLTSTFRLNTFLTHCWEGAAHASKPDL